MRYRDFKIVETWLREAGEVVVIGDSHAKAMGGSNNLAANGAKLDAIARQADRVPEGATVYMTGGHNDVTSGATPQAIASKVMTIMQMLERKGCTVNYILFPEGTDNNNQENMAPTRQAISSAVDVSKDLDGCSLQGDGIHCTLGSYRGIVSAAPTVSSRGEPEQERASDGELEAGPPYPQEDMDRVRAMQSKLEDLGYSVGSTGVDGKYGPRTTRAVRAFKQDNDISTQANIMSEQELSTLASAEPVENPTEVDQPSTGGDVSDLVGNEDLITRARQTAEEFLGREMSDDEFNYLIRASAAEASANSQERAGVAAVMLNRARENHNGYGRSVIDQLEAPAQFQAVTGVMQNGSWTGPSSNFSDMTSGTGEQVMASIVRYLPRMDRSWQNFTSNNPRAYGRGTNINFMYAMRNARDSQVIGQTVFGTV